MNNALRQLYHICRKYWWQIFLSILLYSSLFQLMYNLLTDGIVFAYNDWGDFISSYLRNSIPIYIVIITQAIVVFHLSCLPKLDRRPIVKVFVDILFSAIILISVNIGFMHIYRWATSVTPQVDWIGTILNSLLVMLILEVIYWLIVFKENMIKAEENKRRELVWKCETLKLQVNPHFLFNSLNIMYSLVNMNDKEQSIKFIWALSSIYRYILTLQSREKVPLAEEIDFVTNYAYILKIRYHNQFELRLDKVSSHADKLIVPHTLQLLIENATKHNIISSKEVFTVTIVGEEDAIHISNPIRLKKQSSLTGTGFGTRYICELYASYGKKVTIENDGHIYKVVIPYL